MTIPVKTNHDNNFDFLRFVAATLVLLSHCYPLSGRDAAEPFRKLMGYETGGGLAVAIFFVISGYLVCGSYLNSKNCLKYAWNRSLRLFPALTVAVLFCIFIVGPLYTNMDLQSYFSSGQTWKYLKNIMLSIRYNLPGVFADNPFPNAVNGSLWTLPVEVAMYVCIVVLGIARILSSRFILYIVILFFLCNLRLPEPGKLSFFGISLFYFFKLGAYFFAGSAMYLFREKISLRADIFIVLFIMTAATFHTAYGRLIMHLTLPYLVICFAYAKLGWLSRFGRYGDFSYGIYVFAFPVQQMIMHLYGPDIGIPVFAIVSFVITLILAILSWHLVEHPALRLKRVDLSQYILFPQGSVTNSALISRISSEESNSLSNPHKKDMGSE